MSPNHRDAGLTIEEALAGYVHALRRLRVARGNPRKWNALVDEAQRFHLRLRDTPQGRAGIAELLADSDPDVRAWAAAHALLWDPERARPVLEALRDDAAAPPEVRIAAEVTLDQHERGQLSHDWHPDDG